MSAQLLSRTTFRRLGAASVLAAALALVAGPASAHVTVAADDATRGAADAILTFRVPNEQDAARTVKVQITFPTKDPIASVKPAAVPGWTVTTTPVTFNPPIKTDDGDITQGVGSVTYTATAGGGIAVGDFAAFQILVGPLPDVDALSFPTVQTYSNGQVSRWIQPVTDPANEPESPAPRLELAASADTSSTATSSGAESSVASSSSSASAGTASAAPSVDLSSYATTSQADSARTVGIVGIVVGLLGLAVGGFSVLTRGRRQS